MKKFLYKNFRFEALLYKDHRKWIRLIPKKETFYESLLVFLKSLSTDHPDRRKTFTIEKLQKNFYKQDGVKIYSEIEFIYDRNLVFDEFHGEKYVKILEENKKLIYYYNDELIEVLENKMKNYDMNDAYGEIQVTHSGLLYTPSCFYPDKIQ